MSIIIRNLKSFLIIWFFVLFINQLFIFGGCFAPYCILAALPHTGIISFFILTTTFNKKFQGRLEELDNTPYETSHVNKNSDAPVQQPQKDKKTAGQTKDPFKSKGDAYERHIGKRFEQKGELVVYNGFIRGYEDAGVDLIAISPENKTINLIQCKNWQFRIIELENIEKIHYKLDKYNLDFLHLPISQIKTHLDTKKDDETIQRIISHARDNLNQYAIRKTLYISSDKVVNLEIGKFLTMIKPHIFRYKDMKIVVEKIP